jgi:hypothetical protein
VPHEHNPRFPSTPTPLRLALDCAKCLLFFFNWPYYRLIIASEIGVAILKFCNAPQRADEVESRRNTVSAEPARQKAALPAAQVLVGTPQGCAEEGGSGCTPGGSTPHDGSKCLHVRARRWREGPLPAARLRLHALIV